MNPWMFALGLASILITLIVGFGRVIRSMSRLELKVELMWEHYLSEHAGWRCSVAADGHGASPAVPGGHRSEG